MENQNWCAGVEHHFAGDAWVEQARKKSAFVRVQCDDIDVVLGN